MKFHQYYVYIITNKANVGITSDLYNRVYQHKHKAYPGFSATYNCNKLIYFEQFQWVQDAIAREKQLKGGSRQKKIDLIISINPDWKDLSEEWYD